MISTHFREGDRVKALGTIFKVPATTPGTVTHCYASIWGLYEVQFDSAAERRIVWAEDLEADGPAGVHERLD